MARRPAAKPRAKRRAAAPPRQRAAKIYDALHKLYPDAHCALEHRDAFELLVATILSAQCTDERVNKVTPDLFRRFPDADAMAKATQDELETLIRSTGFYRNKAKNILGAAKRLVEHHHGKVPDTMDDLLQLPGVARKTANVVLGNAFGKNEGVVVDTHVTRLSNRLGLTKHDDPVKIERDLAALFPRENWATLSHLLIFHGRNLCPARKPRCAECPLSPMCPSSESTGKPKS